MSSSNPPTPTRRTPGVYVTTTGSFALDEVLGMSRAGRSLVSIVLRPDVAGRAGPRRHGPDRVIAGLAAFGVPREQAFAASVIYNVLMVVPTVILGFRACAARGRTCTPGWCRTRR